MKKTRSKKRAAAPAVTPRFTKLVHAWHAHVRDELALHRQIHAALAAGRRDVQKHLKQTLALQHRFIQRLKKI